jgi:hypothetical protein
MPFGVYGRDRAGSQHNLRHIRSGRKLYLRHCVMRQLVRSEMLSERSNSQPKSSFELQVVAYLMLMS